MSKAAAACTVEEPAGQKLYCPPEGFKPDFRRGAAWCPYCGRAVEFAWDQVVGYARCPGCGISSEDYYVKSYNHLWDQAEKFAAAVMKSGRVFRSGKEDPGLEVLEMPREDRSVPPWKAPEDKLPRVGVSCPNCGAHIREAYLPTVEKCFTCGSIVSVDRDGKVSCKVPERAVYCSRCGKLLTESPVQGTAYKCERCGTWSAVPGDKAGEKEAAAANSRERRYGRKGQLPSPVLAKVRALAAAECVNYENAGPFGTKHYCSLEPPPDHTCVFFSAQQKHRCRWFEEGVLPLKPALEDVYWQECGQPAVGETEGRQNGDTGESAANRLALKALEEARRMREKVCSRCGRTFVPDRGKEKTKYCSTQCRKKAEAEQSRKWRARSR